jgi:hypothetical protein
MNALVIFGCGAAGSLIIEVLRMMEYVEGDQAKLPTRYKSLLFWALRVLLAIAAGGLAVAYKIREPILAVNVGASAPLILRAFAQGVSDVARYTRPNPEAADPSTTK